MTRLIDLPAEDAKKHFLKGSSYYNGDFPQYISFEPVLSNVQGVLGDGLCTNMQASPPSELDDVNYSLIANKDGRLSWRPFELMNPAIYVSIVNLVCEKANWKRLCARLAKFQLGVVECCSIPVVSDSEQTDKAEQISNWWKTVEQRSLTLSLEYSHIVHTDVSDCYGSLYTHSIPWAIHGITNSKDKKNGQKLLGSRIDKLIQSSRYGQTNGICQGSVLMDFMAELVLGFVDELITLEMTKQGKDFHILRYRDDYRIFTQNDRRGEEVLKVVSDKLRIVGMRLGVSKTWASQNIIDGSIKRDKLEAIRLEDLGDSNAETIQKKLLRIHAFGLKHPNSGSLKRLLTITHQEMQEKKIVPDDLDVQIAIATDIGFVSPSCFPIIAAILSHLISLKPPAEKQAAWLTVRKKMSMIPYNGYLEIWLQRVVKPSAVGIDFNSDEKICKVVNGETCDLWNNSWISNKKLVDAMNPAQILIASVEKVSEVVKSEEIKLFKENIDRFDS